VRGLRLNLDRLRYADLRPKADEFLQRYRQRLGPPVMIEEIVEFDLQIAVVPVPGLLQKLDIDGFTASDLTRIHVDKSVFDHPNESRYRFTLAHEVGHVTMHRRIFERFSFSSLDEYREFVRTVDEDDYGWLEWQAYCFAGLVLVPAAVLRDRFQQELASARVQQQIQEAQELGLGHEDYVDHLTTLLAERVARHFHVSPDVVARRIGYDDLAGTIP